MTAFTLGFLSCWALLVAYGLSCDARRYLADRRDRRDRRREPNEQAAQDLRETDRAVVH